MDLLTHGSPCTSFSVAGKQEGGDEGSGTKSSLMWHTVRIVEDIKPKYVIWEQVPNVLSKKHKHNFDKYINKLEELGYKNHFKKMNSKYWGVPQNRNRLFTVSIRKDLDDGTFQFPISSLEGQMSLFNDNIVEVEPKVLKDVLQCDVREKYYLSDKAIQKLERHNNDVLDNPQPDISSTIHAGYFKMGGRDQQYVGVELQVNQIGQTSNNGSQAGKVYDNGGIFPNICAGTHGYANGYTLDINKIGNIYPSGGQNGNIYTDNGISPALRSGQGDKGRGIGSNNSPKIVAQRGRYNENGEVEQQFEVKEDNNTITSVQKDNYVTYNYRIRKLTPLECFRLQAFDDEDYFTAKKALEEKFYNGNDRSDTQCYKMAGNSITVTVLEEIFKVLFKF